MKQMTESEKMSILTKEYIFLMNAYEMFDQRALLIKSWAFTLISGGIGFSYVYPEGQVAILVLSLLGSVVFWYLETTWKSFQYHFTPRIQDIETFMRGEAVIEINPLQIHTQWFVAFRANHTKGFYRTSNMPIVRTPYLYLIIVILAVLGHSQV